MIRALAITTIALLGVSDAWAGTIAVVAESEEGPLPASTFQSVVWHAMYNELGHDAIFMDRLDASIAREVKQTPITTVVHLQVSWKADSVRVDGTDGDVFLVGGHYPVITATEYEIQGTELHARTAWQTEGPISVFQVKGNDEQPYISMPEVSLQETTALAVQPVQAPVWRMEPEWVRIPLVVAADDDYRAYYGDRWKQVADRAVNRANAVLRPAGIKLEVASHEEWVSPEKLTDLSSLLEHMSDKPIDTPGAVRVGFTGQTRLAVEWQSQMEDVGRAYLPGQNLIIADQAANPGHDPQWDVAEEGVAVAHELMHALGIPHLEENNLLMSATKRGTVHRMHPSSVSLARTAALSRYTHWDTKAALTALSHAAEAHLDDPDLQFEYISDNLAFGPGIPAPGTLEPGELSALTNVAMAHYYLRQAQKDPTNARKLQAGAKRHADTALEKKPQWQQAKRLQREVRAAVVQRAPAIAPPCTGARARQLRPGHVRSARRGPGLRRATLSADPRVRRRSTVTGGFRRPCRLGHTW